MVRTAGIYMDDETELRLIRLRSSLQNLGTPLSDSGIVSYALNIYEWYLVVSAQRQPTCSNCGQTITVGDVTCPNCNSVIRWIALALEPPRQL
ncbi:MAG: hypothetical protein H3Z53_08880 [archaeon]|nr:hypothetical protein [archaeon]MCP8320748.1 hypothetical protein [archaeon]